MNTLVTGGAANRFAAGSSLKKSSDIIVNLHLW